MAVSNFKDLMAGLSAGTSILRELTPDEKQKLQETLVAMFQDVWAVCRKYNLTIMLGGGSALGAVRHKGFIPWDDDLDLLMPRADFEILQSVFEQELGERYILSAPNYSEKSKARFPKIFSKETVFKELTDINTDLPCGVFLDVFLLEKVPENKLRRMVKGYWCSVLMLGASRAFWYEHRCVQIKEYMYQSFAGKKTYALHMVTGFIFHLLPSWKWFRAVDKSVQFHGESSLWGIPTGRKHYFGEIFPASVYAPTAWAEFEGIRVPVPGNCDTYLRNLYGEYMQIPPIEKRERHYVVDLQF